MKLIAAGLTLIFLGFILLFLGVVLQVQTPQTTTSSSPQFAGLVLLGPIPIAFGNVPPSVLSNLIIVGVVFTIIMLIIYLIMFIIGRKTTRAPF
ncbi:Protein of unknown function DUF131 [Sulfolobus islandicus Y.G.57.14]|jgi:uncharacterized protein (TIGR00304 family)|uniref:DUF131 domain-containing protein n=11 Tax=Saccharolobus TaxID=2100760 RepID=Q97ZV4_SACS2|nr:MULTISPECIES: DUF131 domain-containing protein [Sulfolobaceae]AAK40794.1 Conserved hypothetical protein [Saccharolobus solfataricus P2]ACP35756.1 Protein of unknown function DUF131 [Sulfolobus islandicus L.S.2.15]ACP38381.1 Protein of unknown function DUF131 [Sulfolobus islandicus M.14.25]ACP45980.1 Protein of unknown function DUF131 [Sulfolobus islandicus Y.G.57.14]ACP48285.1 Protein of unknown function DUF131 [Sulfolobus islandicus Y.N.15.51]